MFFFCFLFWTIVIATQCFFKSVMFRKSYNDDDEDDDDDNEEEKQFSESLSEIERSISLCTLCDAETKACTSQRSTFFVPSLPLGDESSGSYSFENTIVSFDVETKRVYCTAALFEDSRCKITSPYLQSEAFPLFFMRGTTPVFPTTPDNQVDDDDVPKSPFKVAQKPRESNDEGQEEDMYEKTKQQRSVQKKSELHFITNEKVSFADDFFSEQQADAVNRELSKLRGKSILGDIGDYYENDPYEPAKTPTSHSRDVNDALRSNGEEKKLYANGKTTNKDSVGNIDESNVEAPRAYHSNIHDDEIPKKRAKVSQDGRAEPSKERKRTGGSQSVSPTTNNEPIPCKRSKIVEIAVLNTPNKVVLTNIDESTPQDYTQTVSTTTEPRSISASVVEEELSFSHSQEIPLAFESTKLLKFKLSQVNTDKLASNKCYADAEDAKHRGETVPQVPANADNGLASSEELARVQTPEAEQAMRSEKQRANADPSDGSASRRSEERSKIKNKQLSAPENGVDNVAVALNQRRLSNTWSEIESAFATSREKKPLICRKSKPVTSVTSSAPSVKRLRTKITKQRNSLTSTLTRLQNLSSYMDQIRDTILAEDDGEKEYTVVKKSGAAVGPTTKIMVSTGTQTIDLPSSHPPTPSLAVATSSIAASTQTDFTASNLPIESAGATLKNEPEVERPTYAKKPNRKTLNKRRLLTVDKATARAHDAILNATFEEFRSKKRD